MNVQFPDLWIDKKDREKCIAYTAPATGIRVRYADGITTDLKNNLNDLIKYLRRRYFFPIRCNIIITNHPKYRAREDGHAYYGVFYDNEKAYKNKKLYPEIYVAGQIHAYLPIEQVMFTLLHELTHYFQWFFDEEKTRTDRSLEIEATKWANHILQDYMENSTISTPFGKLNIYVDGQLINYLPVKIAFEHPTCAEHPLAACYRVYGAIGAEQKVRVTVEPLADCAVASDSGENYVSCTFELGSVQMSVGTIDSDNYEICLENNGFSLWGLAKQSNITIGIAWVNDYYDGDNRTYFAADPS